MALVNQFQITLKDFLPDQSYGKIIVDRGSGTSTAVSNRLFAKLTDYAKAYQLTLGAVVEQLREEIHRNEPSMSELPRRIVDTKISAADMKRAIEALNALPPNVRTNMGARVDCLIELFYEPDQHELIARVGAIDWRCSALARLARRQEFKQWSLPGLDGSTQIPTTVLEAAASEPLIEVDGLPGFDADKFFKRLLTAAEERGHG
jgi:hypothetical protein